MLAIGCKVLQSFLFTYAYINLRIYLLILKKICPCSCSPATLVMSSTFKRVFSYQLNDKTLNTHLGRLAIVRSCHYSQVPRVTHPVRVKRFFCSILGRELQLIFYCQARLFKLYNLFYLHNI